MASPRTLQLTIQDLTSEGQGVARLGRDVYFVPGALPGETVTARLDGRRKKVWMTRLLSVDTPSADRVEAPCAHYQRCGGCDLQHLQYDAQVNFKQQRVEREFRRYGIEVPEWAAPITASPWQYRRKARLGVRFSKDKQQNFVGFREHASEHLTNINHCQVLPSFEVLDWSAWRSLLESLAGRDRISQIEVVAADNAMALVLRVLKPLSADDKKALADFVSHHGAKMLSDTVAGSTLESGQLPENYEVQLWTSGGRGTEPECLYPDAAQTLVHMVDEQPLKMQLSDFFQVNGAVNRTMVMQAIDWLNPQPDDVIWDLFAGHGNFSMPLARRCQQVHAVEVQDSMVSSLRQQAESLALSLHAVEADLSEPGKLAALPQPDKVLLDPPRAGAAAQIDELNARKVSQIVYVSCDAATLARDLGRLTEAGYRVEKAGIMDMFPQTHHVETMVLLSHQGK